MEEKKKYLDVTIDGRQFRIGRISAATGNWIVNSFQDARTNEDLFRSIQGHCFAACQWLKVVDDKTITMPLFERPDRWLMTGMADDFDTAQQLYDAVIDFNFSDFFQRYVAKRVAAEKKPEVDPDTQSPTSPQV